MGDKVNTYFKKFQETGKIEDYLAYAKHKKTKLNIDIQKGTNNGINRRDNSKH